ncbi:hypothetical protein [Methylophaga sulfidovorans]|uniref:Uncharacterized protein n=1 Tax=Methylophaga sulfidovorans TaxID=45496 RepID=A0A1I4AEK6_9GAMM|nr:hypothetical protein [Methylophaga sulfidovorans]SFK54149.1 hypothetical protein SAMN04488079_11417 [Methylophaga sulfidovorans]
MSDENKSDFGSWEPPEDVSDEFKAYVEECKRKLGFPNHDPHPIEKKEFVISLMHYIALERIEKDPTLFDEVKYVFGRLSERDTYHPYFTEAWTEILNDEELFKKCYLRSDYMDEIRRNSPVHKVPRMFTDSERYFLICLRRSKWT